jgi:general secretion pathway protein H
MTARTRGFTLIEILVVVLLLVIMMAMVGLKLGGDDRKDVRQESERLAALLLMTQQEAILQGRVLAVLLQDTGYQFQGVDDKNHFVDLDKDSLLRPYEFPNTISIRAITLDGAPAGKEPRVILFPTGELAQAFEITLSKGDVRWYVEGGLDGAIRSSQEPHA